MHWVQAGPQPNHSRRSVAAKQCRSLAHTQGVCTTIASLTMQELTAQAAYELLKRISDEDIELMGFHPKYARPEWMIITVLPVPPPAVRPSILMDASARYGLASALMQPVEVDIDLWWCCHLVSGPASAWIPLQGMVLSLPSCGVPKVRIVPALLLPGEAKAEMVRSWLHGSF